MRDSIIGRLALIAAASASLAACATGGEPSVSTQGMPGALDALTALGIDPERRAETLGVDDFIDLARRLS